MAANNPILEAAEEGGEPSKQRKLGSKVNEIENSLEKRKKSLDWELSLQVAEKGASILSSFLSDTIRACVPICSSMRPPPSLSLALAESLLGVFTLLRRHRRFARRRRIGPNRGENSSIDDYYQGSGEGDSENCPGCKAKGW